LHTTWQLAHYSAYTYLPLTHYYYCIFSKETNQTQKQCTVTLGSVTLKRVGFFFPQLNPQHTQGTLHQSGPICGFTTPTTSASPRSKRCQITPGIMIRTLKMYERGISNDHSSFWGFFFLLFLVQGYQVPYADGKGAEIEGKRLLEWLENVEPRARTEAYPLYLLTKGVQ